MVETRFTPAPGARAFSRVLGCLLIGWLWAGWPAQAAWPGTGSAALESTDLATGFEEPLIATGPTSLEEDEALARAVASYRGQAANGDYRALEDFLAGHPQSAWRVAILTNLGLSYYSNGYFSKSIDALKQAWKEGRSVTEPRAKALVDRAVGELLKMHARLGHSEQLAALFEEIGERALTGPATELQAGAKEGLWMMRNEPGVAYLCGPMALKNLLLAKGVPVEKLAFLDAYRSGPQGVTLAEVARLAEQGGLSYRLVRRKAGEPIPVPSVVHWKVSHFAAIVGESEGRYRIEDPTFGQTLWVTRDAIDTEESGYFLVPGDRHSAEWRDVEADEASRIRGMGFTSSNKASATTPDDDQAKPGICPRGMCGYNFTEMVVSLNLNDRPVGYAPPKGPPAYVTLTYNQREASQPANLGFFNISPKWTLNWLSYIQDDPANAAHGVTRYVAGGGSVSYDGYNTTTHAFLAETRDATRLVRTSATPIMYQRQLSDGSTEVYAQSDGATVSPRRIFLTQIIDPAGNAVTLNYDNRLRLTSLTDATGRSTTFSYGLSARPLLVTQITDPFGRSATLTYDSTGRLSSITDVLGLTSSFAYDASSLVNAMTTPYGTTSFAHGETTNNASRFVQATDPLGLAERLEFRIGAPGIPDSDPPSTVPQGMATTNGALDFRNTFYWDKRAYQVAAGDYTKARNKHWVHFGSATGDTVESLKQPLENRVWYNYPGQIRSFVAGTYDLPTRVGRVLDDGTTKLTQLQYNAAGNPTSVIDPVGRQTLFTYASNQIDALAIQQKTASGNTAIGQFTYNAQHLPLTYTDAAGQTTSYAYNAAGQLTSVTNPLGQTTSFQYEALGYLKKIINANGKIAASFTYDAFSRIATYTDTEGRMVGYAYDAADRVTQITYPDGTTDQYFYDKLDLATIEDRQGRVWSYTHDANRRLVAVTDPLGHETQFGYTANGQLKRLTDPNGNVTKWTYDVAGRPVSKVYADGTQVAYAYETTTSRLKSVTDALGQAKQYTYTLDDRIAGISYPNALNPTPDVSFAWATHWPQISAMTDGTGTTQYAYVPVGSPGARKLQQETGPLAGAAIAYAYDALGRVASRTVGGADLESFQYDAIGRLVTHGHRLGQFALSYLGETGQLAQRQLVGGTVATKWGYLDNTGDRRLSLISNVGLRKFNYTTTPENLITGIVEKSCYSLPCSPLRNWGFGYDDADRLVRATVSDAAAPYKYTLDPAGNITQFKSPTAATKAAAYNNVNEVTSLAGQPFVYDANGNLLSDGQRNYAWDAENRLVKIKNISSGTKTVLAYDGLDRRAAITTTTAGRPTTQYHLWCGARPCQLRNADSSVARSFYTEGEFIAGSGTRLYYGPDQLGSVRDALAVGTVSTTAQVYNYDPYGNPTQSPPAGMQARFRYAGMFYHQDSGLYLTQYRAYDPRIARWLSRDPIEERGGVDLYAYVAGNPVLNTDPSGEFVQVILAYGAACLANPICRGAVLGAINGAIAGAIAGYDATCGSWNGALLGAAEGGVIGALFGAIDLGEVGPLSRYLANVAGGATGAAFVDASSYVFMGGRAPEFGNDLLIGGFVAGAISIIPEAVVLAGAEKLAPEAIQTLSLVSASWGLGATLLTTPWLIEHWKWRRGSEH